MSIERIILAVVLFVATLPALAGLNIQHWSLPRGGEVYFVENHDLPMIDISVDFSAGSARDDRARSGLAAMTNRMLTLGAGPWSEQQIAERLAEVGANLGGRFDQDRGGLTLRTLSSPAERSVAFDTLRAVLSSPRFDEVVLARERERAISAIREASVKPEYQGEKAFQAAVYGDHPYALQEEGEIDTLARLGVADLRAFHARYYVPSNMVIAVMGDIRRAEVEDFAQALADALPQGRAPMPIPAVPKLAAGSTLLLPHHASQSHLFIGMPGMKRVDPDYFPLLVGNYILGGGGFDSRIMAEVRQKRGLAYSAYSYFSPMQELGRFQIGLQTRREATDEALSVVRDTLRRFIDEGPTDAEVEQARNNLVGGFPLRLDSNKKIQEHLAMIGFYRLPLDWLETYPRAVDSVTRADIMRAFRSRVIPDAMATVIVGGQVATEKK